MSTATLIGILLLILVLNLAIWFLIERTRDHRRYRDEVVKRLRNISR